MTPRAEPPDRPWLWPWPHDDAAPPGHEVRGGAAFLCSPGTVRGQARVAMAWFSVFEGRITASALAGSGW